MLQNMARTGDLRVTALLMGSRVGTDGPVHLVTVEDSDVGDQDDNSSDQASGQRRNEAAARV